MSFCLNPPILNIEQQLDNYFQKITDFSEDYGKIMIAPTKRTKRQLEFKDAAEPPRRKRELTLGFQAPEEVHTSFSHLNGPQASPIVGPFVYLRPPINVNTGIDRNSTMFVKQHPSVSGVGNQIYPMQPVNNDYHFQTGELNSEELVKMKGPSRLIGFLVTIAMDERSSKALRWTGRELEFVLVDRELVARMWGNRKHNTKDMDYLKLSRAIREKYEKRNSKGDIIKPGKLAKGSKIYSYIFTEHAYEDLVKFTEKSIPEILSYAKKIGEKYEDSDQSSNSEQYDEQES